MIVIRCDSTSKQGLGHLNRCLRLAERVSPLVGQEVQFVCTKETPNFNHLILSKGFALEELESDRSSDFIRYLDGLSEKPVFIILDGYHFETQLEKKITEFGTLMVIDDFSSRTHYCHYLLDNNYGTSWENYCKRETVVLKESFLGSKFSLVDPAFENSYKPRSLENEILNGLIFFGGADPKGYLPTLLQEEVKSLLHHYTFVVLDPNTRKDVIKQILPNIQVVINPTDWPKLVSQSDFYFGSGGTVTWERLINGLPGFVMAVAENQVPASRALGEQGYQIYLGKLGPEEVFEQLSKVDKELDRNLLCEMSRKSQEVVQVFSKGILRRIFNSNGGIVQVRRAQLSDEEALFRWRNHEKVYRFFRTPAPVSLRDHQVWLSKTLSDPNRFLFIGIGADGEAIGMVRFDIENSKAQVSIHLNPTYFGRGYGALLLLESERAMNKNVQIQEIQALVHEQNRPSAKMFEKCGYCLNGREHGFEIYKKRIKNG